MATQKEINAWLKSVNLKKDDIDKLWDELAELGHPIARNSKAHNWSWQKLSISVIPDIIGMKEKMLQTKAKKEEELRLKKQQEEEAIRIAALDTRTDEQKLLDQILAKDCIVSELIGSEYEIHQIEGENNRWTQDMQTIVKVCGRYFSIAWQRGLTEMQENDYYAQPVEVEPKQEVITITKWVPKEQK